MTFEISGTLIKKFNLELKQGKFKEQKFVISQDIETKSGKYTNYIQFVAKNEATDDLQNLSIGEEIDIKFLLNGYEFDKGGEKVYHTTLRSIAVRPSSSNSSQDLSF